MWRFAAGELFATENYQKQESSDCTIVLVDVDSGSFDIIAVLHDAQCQTQQCSCRYEPESSISMNHSSNRNCLTGLDRISDDINLIGIPPFSKSLAVEQDSSENRRRRNDHLVSAEHYNLYPCFLACLAFIVDTETNNLGTLIARDLLVADRIFGVRDITENIRKRIVEENLRSMTTVPAHQQEDNVNRFCVTSGCVTSQYLDKDIRIGGISLCRKEKLKFIAKQVIHLKIDAQSAGWLSVALKRSPSLLTRFLHYCHNQSSSLKVNKCFWKESFEASVTSYRHVIVHLTYPQKVWLDYAWYYRLEALIVKRIILDDLMNWLSTLGGAYSSLGDYSVHHAENAAAISLKQLRIAVEMGSPPLIIRCYLFFALSLMQRGQYRRAKIIIRQQYNAAKELPITDEQLLFMCKGIWNRLRYHWQKRQNKLLPQKLI